MNHTMQLETPVTRAKTQSVVISTQGRNLSQIPRPLGMTDFGPSLGVLGALARVNLRVESY